MGVRSTDRATSHRLRSADRARRDDCRHPRHPWRGRHRAVGVVRSARVDRCDHGRRRAGLSHRAQAGAHALVVDASTIRRSGESLGIRENFPAPDRVTDEREIRASSPSCRDDGSGREPDSRVAVPRRFAHGRGRVHELSRRHRESRRVRALGKPSPRGGRLARRDARCRCACRAGTSRSPTDRGARSRLARKRCDTALMRQQERPQPKRQRGEHAGTVVRPTRRFISKSRLFLRRRHAPAPYCAAANRYHRSFGEDGRSAGWAPRGSNPRPAD